MKSDVSRLFFAKKSIHKKFFRGEIHIFCKQVISIRIAKQNLKL